MEVISLLSLITLIVAIAANVVFAILVYKNKPNSSTNRIFFLLSIVISLWLITNHLSILPSFLLSSLFTIRLSIFFAAPMSVLFFMFAHTFPYEKLQMRPLTVWTITIITVIVMLINISPYAFTEIAIIDDSPSPVASTGIVPFAVLSTIFSLAAIVVLIKKLRKAHKVERNQLKYVVTGISVMLSLIIATIFIPVVFFKSNLFVAFIPLYSLIFLAYTAYAIVKFGLFDVRVIATQLLTFAIWIFWIIQIVIAPTTQLRILNILFLILTVFFGIFLIKSIFNEVRAREEIERLATTLKKANSELRKLDKVKSEFISIASHQLRTPLSIIKGYISMMREEQFGKLTDSFKNVVDKIYVSNERLIKLVNDMLDLSRMESGRMQYEFISFDINELVTSIIDEFKVAASNKDLVLKTNISNQPITAWGDPQKLRQVIFNLIDNAIKYSSKGNIVVNIKIIKNTLEISVKDVGVGISKNTIDKLFQKFSREEKVAKEHTEGAGLGLYIAKRIIDDHKGHIWAESEGEGKGSTFYLQIPLQRVK